MPFLLFFINNMKNKNLSTRGHFTVVEYKGDGVTPKTVSGAEDSFAACRAHCIVQLNLEY